MRIEVSRGRQGVRRNRKHCWGNGSGCFGCENFSGSGDDIGGIEYDCCKKRKRT